MQTHIGSKRVRQPYYLASSSGAKGAAPARAMPCASCMRKLCKPWMALRRRCARAAHSAVVVVVSFRAQGGHARGAHGSYFLRVRLVHVASKCVSDLDVASGASQSATRSPQARRSGVAEQNVPARGWRRLARAACAPGNWRDAGYRDTAARAPRRVPARQRVGAGGGRQGSRRQSTFKGWRSSSSIRTPDLQASRLQSLKEPADDSDPERASFVCTAWRSRAGGTRLTAGPHRQALRSRVLSPAAAQRRRDMAHHGVCSAAAPDGVTER